ncbi:MaoC family dehydratase [Spirillospora sp. CA-142024]|uniref:MaoC family dehydratase n=1 Tax=Spirillospora sp. CA-142024 TaxID=3240036 RepID=UPI003D8F4CFB
MTETASAAEPLVRGMTWEDMKEGAAFRTAARTVTETDLMSFVHLGGFNEPLFYDARHASEGGYTGRLLPGALVYVLAEGLILQTNVLHGTGLAFMHMEFSVKRPTYVGDTLHVVVEITGSRPSSKPGRGVVSSRCGVINQRGEEVAVFTPVRLIRGRDFADGRA